jgi:hypothetical protein
MRSNDKTLKLIGSLSLFLAIMLSAVSAYAQAQWPLPADPLMVVIPVRGIEEIATDLDNAMDTKQLAMYRNAQAVDRLAKIATAIDSREASVDDMNRRKNSAKDNKRDAEETSLKIEAKANKQAVDLLKRLRDLRKTEVEAAKIEEDHADLTIRVFQLESELQSKRSEYGWQSFGGAGDLTQNTAHQVVDELEVSLLKLQEKLANTTKDVASKQKDVVKRRMKLHEAQLKLGI